MSKFTLEQIEAEFPKDSYGSIYFNYDYVDKNLGEELITVSDNDYQGKTRILLQDGDRYAIYIYSWGSCSGCDFMRSCETHQEFLNYANDAYNSLEWIPKNYMLERLNNLLKEEKSSDWVDENDVLFYEKSIALL